MKLKMSIESAITANCAFSSDFLQVDSIRKNVPAAKNEPIQKIQNCLTVYVDTVIKDSFYRQLLYPCSVIITGLYIQKEDT